MDVVPSFSKNSAEKYFSHPPFHSGYGQRDGLGSNIHKREGIILEIKGKRSITVILFLLFLGIPYSIQAGDQEWDPEEVFVWVAQKLGISPEEEMPRIIELDEKDLREHFLMSTEKSLKRLRESLIDMGWDRVEASNYVDNLANDVVGFLTKNDRIIYIKSSLEPCYKASILAHEITHFFQVKFNLMGEEGRELQAEYMERKYREEHCPAP